MVHVVPQAAGSLPESDLKPKIERKNMPSIDELRAKIAPLLANQTTATKDHLIDAISTVYSDIGYALDQGYIDETECDRLIDLMAADPAQAREAIDAILERHHDLYPVETGPQN